MRNHLYFLFLTLGIPLASPVLAAPSFLVPAKSRTVGDVLSMGAKIAGLGEKKVTLVVRVTATVTCADRDGRGSRRHVITVPRAIPDLRPEDGKVVFSVMARASRIHARGMPKGRCGSMACD